MLVANPREQKLTIQVKDSIGLTDITIGTGEVNLSVCRRFPFCNACPFIFDIRLCPTCIDGRQVNGSGFPCHLGHVLLSWGLGFLIVFLSG